MDVKNIRKRIVFSAIIALVCVWVFLMIPKMVTNEVQKKFMRHGYPIVFVEQDISGYDQPFPPHTFLFSSPWQNPTHVNWFGFWANFLFFFFVSFGILGLYKSQKFNYLNALKVVTLILVAFLALRFYQTQLRHEAHMHFPLTSTGTFIEQPHLVVEDGIEKVRWVLPGSCVNNAYKAVTSDYVEDVGATIWIGGGANCTKESSERSVCTTLFGKRLAGALETPTEFSDSREVQGPLSVWLVATGFDCSWGDTYISSTPLVIKPRKINPEDQNL